MRNVDTETLIYNSIINVWKNYEKARTSGTMKGDFIFLPNYISVIKKINLQNEYSKMLLKPVCLKIFIRFDFIYIHIHFIYIGTHI